MPAVQQWQQQQGWARPVPGDPCSNATGRCSLADSAADSQVAGYLAMSLTMPTMLGWVLGGNIQNLSADDRLPYCNLTDAPKAFDQAVCARQPGCLQSLSLHSCHHCGWRAWGRTSSCC